MTTLRTAAVLGVIAAAAVAGSAGAAPGGAQMSSTSQQSISSSVVSSSGGMSSSSVSVSQSSGSGSVAVQAVATSPPGPRLSVRLPARRVKELLADREARLEVTADRAAAVDLTVTLRWRPLPGRRGHIVLLHRQMDLAGGAARRLRLGTSARGLDRLPDTGRITILVAGRAAAGVAVGLQLTA